MLIKKGQDRNDWMTYRRDLEGHKKRRKVFAKRRQFDIDYFGIVLKIARFFLKLTGILKIMPNNYHKIIVRENELFSSKIKEPIRILHLSDLHLDENPDIVPLVMEKLKSVQADICIITGDFGTYRKNQQDTIERFNQLLPSIKEPLPVICILGNHDGHDLVAGLENGRLTFLTNQFVDLKIHNNNVRIIGCDDVHYFYRPENVEIFKNFESKDLNIALVHSPEIFDKVQESGADFYFCGHSHGGQIRLPPLRLITRCKRGRQFYIGRWVYQNMHGFTHSGIGASIIKWRLNTHPELVIHHIKPVSS